MKTYSEEEGYLFGSFDNEEDNNDCLRSRTTEHQYMSCGVADWKRRHAFFIKCVSTVLILVFLHQQTGWSQDGKPVWAYAKPFEELAYPQIDHQKNITGEEFEIPYDVASKQEVAINGGDETIFHIQDVLRMKIE